MGKTVRREIEQHGIRVTIIFHKDTNLLTLWKVDAKSCELISAMTLVGEKVIMALKEVLLKSVEAGRTQRS